MSTDNHLLFLLIILVIVLLIKFYFDSKHSISNNDSENNHANSYEINNAEFSKMAEEVHKETLIKINNAVEQGVIEGFSDSVYDTNTNISNTQRIESDGYFDTDDIVYHSDFNVKTIKEASHKYKESNKNRHNNDNIISYLNKGNSVRLMLFYKSSCPYCNDFMPVWYKIVNNLANNVMYEEIDCEKDYKKANEYQITSVPTIILLVNNEKKVYMGDRNYLEIMRFLKINGVRLIERTFEEFNSVPQTPFGNTKKTSLCPSVTFNSELEVAEDNYMFQIFNADGQYGYATGGNNPGKLMTPFTAAYSTVDSYLSSLPDGANVSECANNYAEQIRGFGLCDSKQLDSILQYQANVANGNAMSQIDGTDYSTNKEVITAIKNTCGL